MHLVLIYQSQEIDNNVLRTQRILGGQERNLGLDPSMRGESFVTSFESFLDIY